MIPSPPWAVLRHGYIVPLDHVNRPIGFSVEPDYGREHYAHVICRVHDRYGDADDTAALIVRAVNCHEDLLDALYAARAALAANTSEPLNYAVIAKIDVVIRKVTAG